MSHVKNRHSWVIKCSRLRLRSMKHRVRTLLVQENLKEFFFGKLVEILVPSLDQS